MADESDVINAFKALLVKTLYPTGVPGNQVSPVATVPVSVMGGWPLPSDVDQAMTARKVLISIYPRPEERTTSRLQQAYLNKGQNATGTTVSVNGQAVTFGGAPVAGDIIAVSVDAAAAVQLQAPVFGYGVNSADTPASIATALAGLIPGASSAGAVLTVPALEVGATVTGSWSVLQETGRLEKRFQISVWAPKYDLRDSVAKVLKPVLDLNYRLNLVDGTQTTTRHGRQLHLDELQKQQIYRRDFFYYAEWATTTAPQTAPALVIPEVNLYPEGRYGGLDDTFYVDYTPL